MVEEAVYGNGLLCFICDLPLTGRQRKFCSYKCRKKDFRNRHYPIIRDSETCLWCDALLTGQQMKFCSTYCIGTYHSVYNRDHINKLKRDRRVSTLVRESETCLQCGIVLTGRRKKYCSRECDQKYNRQRKSEYDKKYVKENAEYIKLRRDIYYEENKEAALEYSKRWVANNREKSREIKAAWKERNPEAVKSDAHNRRAMFLEADGTFTDEDVVAIYLTQDGFCYYCQIDVEDSYHVDHKTPLSRGGSNWPDNLAIACGPCNMRKNKKTAEEFFALLEKEAANV